mgnify:CR=1 FL=1
MRHYQNSCNTNKDKTQHKCKYCGKIFTRKNNLISHAEKCIGKDVDDLKSQNNNLKKDNKHFKLKLKEKDEKISNMKKIIKEKDKEIISLRSKFDQSTGKLEVYDKVCDKVLDKSTITNTNTSVTSMYVHPKLVNIPINNIHPLTIEYIKDKVDNGGYTLDHYLRGEQGLADFIYSLTTCENADGILEMNYACTDLTRDSYHRLVETKEWKKDKGGKYMDVIFDSISGQVNTYHMDMFAKRTDKNFKPSLSFDPDYIFKFNTDMHAGIVQTSGKERSALVQRIKKKTSRKICV